MEERDRQTKRKRKGETEKLKEEAGTRELWVAREKNGKGQDCPGFRCFPFPGACSSWGSTMLLVLGFYKISFVSLG